MLQTLTMYVLISLVDKKQNSSRPLHLPKKHQLNENTNNYFLRLSEHVSKRGILKLLYPYKSPPILFPMVLSPHISTNLLLQTACISHTVDLYLCSLCFISLLMCLSCILAFSLHHLLLPLSVSPSHYQSFSVISLSFQLLL